MLLSLLYNPQTVLIHRLRRWRQLALRGSPVCCLVWYPPDYPVKKEKKLFLKYKEME
jgi:hypothetical protein